MDFTTYNTKRNNFTNAKDNSDFVAVKDLDCSKVYRVDGIFFADSKFGKRCFVNVFTGEKNINVDLPKSANDKFSDLCKDENAVNAINNGECGIKFGLYYSKKYDKDNCTTFELVNIENAVF